MFYTIQVVAIIAGISITAASVFSSSFYTTDTISEVDIDCATEEYSMNNEHECAVQCERMDCYKFLFVNGKCKIRRKKMAAVKSGKTISVYKKVKISPIY